MRGRDRLLYLCYLSSGLTRKAVLVQSLFMPGTEAIVRLSWRYGRWRGISTCSIVPREPAEYVHLLGSLTKIILPSLSLPQSPNVQGMNQTEILRQLNKLHASNISPSSSQSSLSLESARTSQMQGNMSYDRTPTSCDVSCDLQQLQQRQLQLPKQHRMRCTRPSCRDDRH